MTEEKTVFDGRRASRERKRCGLNHGGLARLVLSNSKDKIGKTEAGRSIYRYEQGIVTPTFVREGEFESDYLLWLKDIGKYNPYNL